MMDRVLVKRFQAPKKSTGGLYLPESAQKDEIPQVPSSFLFSLFLSFFLEISNFFVFYRYDRALSLRSDRVHSKKMATDYQLSPHRNFENVHWNIHCIQNMSLSMKWMFEISDDAQRGRWSAFTELWRTGIQDWWWWICIAPRTWNHRQTGRFKVILIWWHCVWIHCVVLIRDGSDGLKGRWWGERDKN